MPTEIPAWIFVASNPGGKAGSEKSTVSGSWPTNNTRFKPRISLIAYSRISDGSCKCVAGFDVENDARDKDHASHSSTPEAIHRLTNSPEAIAVWQAKLQAQLPPHYTLIFL
jgi:hypothetical protein